MKRIIVIMLGALVVMLLAMPVMAETAPGEYYGASPVARGEWGSMDTQTPVLDGSAFTNYDTIFVPGNAAEMEDGNVVGVAYARNWAGYYYISFDPGTGSSAYIDCPIPSFESKTGGIHPKVRYVAFSYSTPFSNPAVIDFVEISNGNTLIFTKTYSPPISSGVFTVQIIDMGSWYTFNRGLTLAVHARNTNANYARDIRIEGYGARFEW